MELRVLEATVERIGKGQIRRVILWGAGSAGEPHYLLHGHTDALGEGGDPTLEINEKGF